jgi:hypothetical protein
MEGTAFTVWGPLITQSQFRDNNELRHFPAMDTQDNREDLGMEGSVFGALFMYPRLKQLIINTLAHDYSSLTAKRSLAKKCLAHEVRPNQPKFECRYH